MTDLEMTRLCARAMGYQVVYPNDDNERLPLAIAIPGVGSHYYHPLKDDGQALKLAKRFMLELDIFAGSARSHLHPQFWSFDDENINRAIVECVAKLQSDPSFAAPRTEEKP